MKRCVVVGVLLVAVAPAAAVAQGVGHRGLELWAGYATWAGGEVESVDPGPQAGIAILAETATRFGFGGEAMVGRYEQQGQTVTELGLAGLVRYSLGPRSGLHAFLQGRIGWSRLSAASLAQDGFVVGPELGIEVPVSSALRLILAGGGTWRTYENVRVETGGFPLADSGGSGFQYGARIGLSIGEVF